jgi:hypothetical protein
MKGHLIIPVFVIAFASVGAQQLPKKFKEVYKQDFDKAEAIKDFEFTQPDKWLISDEGNEGKCLEFTGISDYQPPFRSPHTIGLINGVEVGSFVLEADLQQTGKEYGHRDMCIIFGFQNASHFYYTHIASKMDDNAHQIMLVNNAARTKISSFTTHGVEWGQNAWHKVRVERDVEKGSIKVFFDGTLVEEANDKNFKSGLIGFGSFDDSGKIDNIRIYSTKSLKKDNFTFANK